jgi:hypothetical protein
VSNPKGIRRPLSKSRRLVRDLLHYSSKVPLVPVERRCNLAELAAIRGSANISWATLFIKAYGLLSQRHAHLRQAFLTWPWKHLYEHPQSVAMVAINREHEGEERLFWGRFIAPETQTLTDLQSELDHYKVGPIEAVFRRQLRLAAFPSPLRRIAWWLTLNSGVKRAKRFGTFGLSTLAGLGAYNGRHPSCLSTSFSYGPVEPNGQTLVTILFDHRIIDGAAIARNLAELETIMNSTIAGELRTLTHQSGKTADRSAA